MENWRNKVNKIHFGFFSILMKSFNSTVIPIKKIIKPNKMGIKDFKFKKKLLKKKEKTRKNIINKKKLILGIKKKTNLYSL